MSDDSAHVGGPAVQWPSVHTGGGRGQIAPGIPIVKPPWGRITAIDLTIGDHAWMVPNGDTPTFVAERLQLPPTSIPNTGRASRAGLLVTRTLPFAGEGTNGSSNLWVQNKRTGARIARLDIPSGTQTGIPMTYLHAGRQYVVFATTASGQPSEIVAYALPRLRAEADMAVRKPRRFRRNPT